MRDGHEQLQGVLATIKFHQANFLIGVLDDGTTVKGNLLSPQVGLEYAFRGRWECHPRWGEQFAFADYRASYPTDLDAVRSYLMENCKWIGPEISKRLVNTYGTETLAVCKESPERIASEIPGITRRRAQEVAAMLRNNEANEKLQLALKDLLGGTKVSRRAANQILETWGQDAPGRIRENPYALIEAIDGIGFLTADEVARKIGYDFAGAPRLRAGIVHTLKEQAFSQGHTCLPRPKLLSEAERILAVPPDRVGTEIDPLEKDGLVVVVDGFVSLKPYYDDEQLVAEKLKVLARQALPPGQPDFEGLADDQQEALSKAVASGVFILTGAPGTGKAQPLDAKVLAPTGWKAMGEIGPSDVLVRPDGGVTTVTSVFPQGRKEIFRVLFSDGSRVECCKEHLWLTTRRDQRKKGRVQTPALRTLEEIIGSLNAPDGASNHTIPMVKPLELGTDQRLPVDPYLLGLLLGDGCFSDSRIAWSNPDAELVQAVRDLLPPGVVLTQVSEIDYRLRKTHGGKTNAFYETIRDLGLWGRRSHEKHVPEAYLFSSLRHRVALLQGLMDTDGSAEPHSAEFTTSSSRLAEGFKFLVQSLGGTTRIVVRSPRYTHNGERQRGRLSYRFHLCLPSEIEPFRLTRKKAIQIPRSRYFPRRIIRSVEYAGLKPAQCIQVDSPDGLYVTDDCVVTHNTYTIKRIISSFPEARVSLAAPTGKAAKRVYEQSGRLALTIHKLLEPQKVGGRFVFTRDAEHPIEADLIVLDEVSMVDTPLMARFLEAVAPGTRLILVGDTYQLPSVGPGNILKDLIASGAVPSTELTIIKRQDEGLIIRNCHAIKNGEDITLENSTARDFFVLKRDGEEEIRETILELVSRRFRESYQADPLREVQVITPLREKTALSCKALNEAFQRRLNPKPTLDGVRFKVGDKVIQTKNQYELDIINGDIGYVRDVDKPARSIAVQFENPDRLVELPLYENDLELAYAVTVHKFQGSEARIIVVPIHRSFGPLIMQRNLLYTAVSRAREVCVLVGQRQEIPKIIQRNAPQRRQTRLKEMLR